MTYDLRLRALAPGTDTPIKVLTEPTSWQASVVHNNDGALKLKYSELADGGSIAARTLNEGLDVALEVNWLSDDDWVEPDNCRFLEVDHDGDANDQAKLHDLTMPSWSWLLNKICDLNLGALAGTKSKDAGKRVFPATSDAGDVVKKMLDEHDARSGPAVPIIRDSWNTAHDSGGNAWLKKLGKNSEGRAYDAGQPLHGKLDALVKNGLCDYRTRGRALRMYNQNSASQDLSATVHLRYGDDLRDAPSRTSQADRVARVLVKGAGKHKATEIDPTVPEFYGRWEAMVDSAGVKDDDDLEDAGKAVLADRNRIKGEYTRTLTMNEAGKLPFRDYNVGDWVTAPGAASDEKLRVMQITITRDEQNGLSGNIVLGDRFTKADLALAGRVSAISGGTSGVIGNGNTTQTPPPDTRQPAAPTGFTVTPTLYLSTNGPKRWLVKIAFSWDALATASDGTALDIASYTVWGVTTGDVTARNVGGAPGNATSVVVDGFMPGTTWTFAVNAAGSTTTEAGLMSSNVALTLPADTVAPVKTSTPVVDSSASVLMVHWDGLAKLTPFTMDADLGVVQVLVDTVTPPVTVAGTLNSLGNWNGYVEAGTGVYVALRPVDISGNVGPLSDIVAETVHSVIDDADLADRLALKSTVYVQDADPISPEPGSWWWTKTAPLKLSYTEDGLTWTLKQVNANLFLAAQTIVAGLLAANSVQSDNIVSDAILARHIRVHEITADKIATGVLTALIVAGQTIRTAETGVRVVIDNTGIVLYDAGDNVVIAIKTDGTSQFTGKITATDLTVKDSLELNSTTNHVNPGAIITLNSGITAPANPPAATSFWDTATLRDSAGAAISPFVVSRATDGKFISFSGSGPTGAHPYTVHNADGSYSATVNPTYIGSGLQGAVVIGSYIYSLEPVGDDGTYAYFNLVRTNRSTGNSAVYNGGIVADWRIPLTNWEPGEWSLSTDGTSLLISHASTVRVYSLTTTSGDSFTSARTATKTSPITIGGSPVHRASYDLGADSVLIGYYTGSGWDVRAYTYSTMAENTAGRFPLATTEYPIGIGYYSSIIWVAQGSKVYFYDGLTWAGTATAQTYKAKYTLYDSVGTTHESAASPEVSVSVKRRAKLRINVAGWLPDTSTADSPNHLRFYAAVGAGTQYAQGNNAAGYITVSTLVVAGSTPPVASTFPGAVPSAITNDSGSLNISADGTIRSKLVEAQMTRTSTGPTYTSGVWTKVTGFDAVDFADGITANASTGELTVVTAGPYITRFYQRWQDYASVVYRLGAIVKGTSAPPSGANAGGPVLALNHSHTDDWYVAMCETEPIDFAVGDKVSFWIRSGTGSTFNSNTDALINKPTYVYMRRIGA